MWPRLWDKKYIRNDNSLITNNSEKLIKSYMNSAPHVIYCSLDFRARFIIQTITVLFVFTYEIAFFMK